MKQVVRFGVSLEKELLRRFDFLIGEKRYLNRSEAIRDLIRENLVKTEWIKGEKVAGVITLVYDHHKPDLSQQLTDIQHHHGNIVVTTTHVHLDNNNCLEVVVLRGKSKAVRSLCEKLVALKGIKHGKMVFTTEGKQLW